MENNFLQIRKEGIFEKIKKWFSKIFYNKKTNENVDTIKENEVEEHERKDFKEFIKVEGKDEILSIQRKLKAGEIKISELTDKELDEMIILYEAQIKEKKNTLKQLKNKLSTDNKEE